MECEKMSYSGILDHSGDPAALIDETSSTAPFEQYAMQAYDDSPFEPADVGEYGADPREATVACPGSEEKVQVLAARYALGLPLWHDNDCGDHADRALGRLADDAADDAEPTGIMGSDAQQGLGDPECEEAETEASLT